MATFGQLKEVVLKKAGVNMFEFRRLSDEHDAFWDKMNEVEYRRGYDPEEYTKPGTPALHEMNLLTDEEFKEWIREFDEIHKKIQTKNLKKTKSE